MSVEIRDYDWTVTYKQFLVDGDSLCEELKSMTVPGRTKKEALQAFKAFISGDEYDEIVSVRKSFK